MSPLNINHQAIEAMKLHALDVFPNECCGFFYGKDGEIRDITLAQTVTNVKDGDQRRRFQIDPIDYMKAEKFAVETGLDLLGIYHSHPLHPAIPSEHDRVVAMPWFSYIILSVNEQEIQAVRSWQLNSERKFEEETILTLK
jgi:proteasome lid subunit RPN8/RPN11